jgi:hypothetical protein
MPMPLSSMLMVWLAQEDFLVGIQRMDHQLQQLLDLGLEAQGLFLGFNAHRRSCSVGSLAA